MKWKCNSTPRHSDNVINLQPLIISFRRASVAMILRIITYHTCIRIPPYIRYRKPFGVNTRSPIGSNINPNHKYCIKYPWQVDSGPSSGLYLQADICLLFPAKATHSRPWKPALSCCRRRPMKDNKSRSSNPRIRPGTATLNVTIRLFIQRRMSDTL